MNKNSLSWNERLALIEHYNPTTEQACEVFGVTSDELATAMQMKGTTLTPSTTIDVAAYAHLFKSPEGETITTHANPTEKNTVTSISSPTTEDNKPITATKRTKTPKKRGRKGSKIATAFKSIPNTPTPLEKFAEEHNVSVAVLRQAKRFDSCPEKGKVRVRLDKDTKILMIQREIVDDE